MVIGRDGLGHCISRRWVALFDVDEYFQALAPQTYDAAEAAPAPAAASAGMAGAPTATVRQFLDAQDDRLGAVQVPVPPPPARAGGRAGHEAA